MELNRQDKENIAKIYAERYDEYGYTPKSLYWDKGKQNLRFDVLTSQFDLNGAAILDIGCGFGDLNKFLKSRTDNYTYLGVDITEAFIHEAKKRYANEKICFKFGDFLSENIENKFDMAFASGTFNLKFENEDNYVFVENVIKKALSLCKTGLAFDFMSDKVDFRYDHAFYYSPEKILSIGYKYTRNIILRNDYMPFEFAMILFKDGSFAKENTIFTTYKNKIKDKLEFLL